MFKDKKLKNTFQLEVLALVSPAIICVFANELESMVLSIITLILAIIAIIISIYVLILFTLNWKKWPQLVFKIAGIILSFLGIFFYLIELWWAYCTYEFVKAFG